MLISDQLHVSTAAAGAGCTPFIGHDIIDGQAEGEVCASLAYADVELNQW